MFRLFFSTLIILILSGSTFAIKAQSASALIQTLEKLKSSITEVAGKSKTFGQELTWESERPYLISFNQEETGKNGKSKSLQYTLSLLDADKNTFRTKTEKDFITIPIYIKGKKKFIKYFEDGSQEAYVEKMSIIAQDIENARMIEELLKEAADLATKMEAEITPKGFANGSSWLGTNVKKVLVNELDYDQQLEFQQDIPTIANFILQDPKNDGEKEQWKFNLGDINPKSVELSTKGNLVFVELQAKKNHYIEYTTESKGRKYINSFEIFVPEIVLGKMMVEVFGQVVKEAEEMEKKRFEKPGVTSTALAKLAESIQTIELNDGQIKQSFTPSCITKYNQTESNAKGNEELRNYHFNLADLNAKGNSLKVSGDKISIGLSTKSLKLVQSFKDEEIQNYGNKVTLMASDLENAKWLQHWIPMAIGHCQAEFEKTFSDQVDANMSTISASITGVGEVDQTLKMVDDDECQWQFVQSETGKNGSEDEVYEFGLHDMNPKEVDFLISGKNLGIQLKTKNNEKIIKYYKNGNPGDYQNKLIIQMNDIEIARKLLRGIKRRVEQCNN